RAEHLLALAAAEGAIGLDAGEHRAEEFGNENALEFLRRLVHRALAREALGRGQRLVLQRRQGRTGDVGRGVHQPITSMSACNAPEALIACRIEITSRGPTPRALSPSTRLCSDTPAVSTVILLPLPSSISTWVRGTTWVVPVLEK